MTFLVCGEALYDVFVEAETTSGFILDARIGGSAFNVAMGLARLGQPVAMVTGVSTDLLGSRLVAAMTAEGVDASRLARKEAPTTLALVSLGADGGARYAFYGAGAADRLVTPEDLPTPGPETRGLLFGCFSILTEPTGSSFLDLARRSVGGPLITLDPNIRPTVEPDMAAWRARVEAFAACADLIKISADDLALLYPGEGHAEVADRWLGQRAGLVVVTRGGDGALARTRSVSVHAPAVPTEVVDTVGAGDSFLAALVCALAETGTATGDALGRLSRDRLANVIGFAAQAAALACARRGAELPRRDALPQLPRAA